MKSQKELRFFCDLKWNTCNSQDKAKIQTMFNFSPRGLIEGEQFDFMEFERRLLKDRVHFLISSSLICLTVVQFHFKLN